MNKLTFALVCFLCCERIAAHHPPPIDLWPGLTFAVLINAGFLAIGFAVIEFLLWMFRERPSRVPDAHPAARAAGEPT